MLTIALSVRERWHSARFHFVVNRNLPAPALARIPEEFGVTLLDTSPTCDDAGVAAALDRCHPDLVLFDNAGSGRQCRNAKRFGARTVFLSTRQVTRARGFQPSWLPWLDEHWIMEPPDLGGDLTVWQRLAGAAARTRVRLLCSVFRPSVPERAERLRRRLRCAQRAYVCFVPGGGGGTVGGRPAVSVFADAAAIVARQTTVPCVLLEGPLHQGPPVERCGVTTRRASHEETVDLIEGAHVTVVGASSTLFQALAQQRVCVATSSGGAEQIGRAWDWAARGIVEAADPEPAALATATLRLLEHTGRWDAIHQQVVSLGVRNDLPCALAAIEDLLTGPRVEG